MDALKKIRNAYAQGSAESNSLGKELHERARMSANALGTPSTASPEKEPVSAPVDRINRGARYGDRAGEKRMDVSESTRTLGSYKNGTDYVPKTGLYKLHEGEKVVTAQENSMEHSSDEKAHFHRAMSHLHGGALHRHLGIPEDQPIPMEKKQEAANSDNPHVAAMGRMAVAMHGWKHGKK